MCFPTSRPAYTSKHPVRNVTQPILDAELAKSIGGGGLIIRPVTPLRKRRIMLVRSQRPPNLETTVMKHKRLIRNSPRDLMKKLGGFDNNRRAGGKRVSSK